MKYSFFLIAILVTGIFLPQDVKAQKRAVKVAKRVSSSSKKVVRGESSGGVKRTVSSKKAKVKSFPPVGPVLSPYEANVIPRCSVDNDHLVVQIYSYPVVTQFVTLKDNKLQVRKLDGSFSSEKSDFISPQDFYLSSKLLAAFEPEQLEMYPAIRSKTSTYISTIVLVKKKWEEKDVEKIHQLLKVLLEPTVRVSFNGGECILKPLPTDELNKEPQ